MKREERGPWQSSRQSASGDVAKPRMPVRALVQCADEDGHEAGEKMNSRAKTRTAAVQYGSEKMSAWANIDHGKEWCLVFRH